MTADGLGPANDTPQVLIEIRAAELAALVDEQRSCVAAAVSRLAIFATITKTTYAESIAWIIRNGGLSTSHGCWGDAPAWSEAEAGWLAHAIVHHEQEQAETG